VPAVAVEDFRDRREFPAARKAAPQVVVLVRAEVGPVPTYGLQRRAAQHDGAVRERVPQKEPAAKARVIGRENDFVHPGSGFVDYLYAGGDEGRTRVCLEEGNLPFEPPRQRDIIGIHTCDVGRRAPCDPVCQRRDETEWFLAKYRCAEARRDLRRAVGGAVVHDDQLISLPENALERLAQKPLAVSHGEHDGDRRSTHVPISS
jgi:hypothetical protein